MAFVVILIVGRLSQKYIESNYDGERAPYLQMLGKDRALIKWQTVKSTKTQVKYGETANNLDKSVKFDQQSKQHEISLTGLKPDTKYWYQIANKLYSFTTAPATDKELLFWVLGDPGRATKALLNNKRNILNRLDKRQLDLMLTTGDNAYTSGTNQQYQDALFNVFGDMLSSVNYWPGYGNHDARRWAFYDIFVFPENAELGGVASQTEEYFSFDYGNTHLIFLNSEYGPLTPAHNMVNWLQQDLKANRKKWTIVIFHSPPYSKGSHDSDSWRDSLGRMVFMREQILPILEQHDVDLVMNGHSHAYERSHLLHCHYGKSTTFKKNMVLDSDGNYEKNNAKTKLGGTIYLIIGSSSKVDLGGFDHPAMPIAIAQTGSVLLQINSNQLTASFINQQGLVLDSFNIIKNQKVRASNSSCDYLN